MQPHGYGPIRQMKDQFIEMFARDLAPQDVLFMPEPAYFGGTVDRSMGSGVIADGVTAQGKHAFALPDRPPAATASSNSHNPATASSSWARATTRCRSSPLIFCAASARRLSKYV